MAKTVSKCNCVTHIVPISLVHKTAKVNVPKASGEHMFLVDWDANYWRADNC